MVLCKAASDKITLDKSASDKIALDKIVLDKIVLDEKGRGETQASCSSLSYFWTKTGGNQ